jgi:capsular exopolysaccharide synthesis family protein
MSGAEPNETPRFASLLWRRKLLILAAVVLGGGLGALYAATASKTYQATAVIEVSVPTGNVSSSDTTATDQALARDYATLLTTRGFLRTIAERGASDGLSPEALQSDVHATSAEESALVTLKTTASSPARARAIATAVVDGFLTHLQTSAASTTTRLQAQLQQQIGGLTTKINALLPRISKPSVAAEVNTLQASRRALIDQSAALVANGLAQGASATLSAPPSASPDPISPRPWLDILAGLILGAIFGIALAWGLDSLRPAIHSAADLTALTDLPVLASIPLNSRSEQALTDAYRVLYTNLRFLLRAKDGRVVTVVSLNAKVGKSSTIEGLAGVVGLDRRVLVVDGDVRTGTLSKRLGHGEHAGLAEVLAERATLGEAIVPIDDAVSLLPARPAYADGPELFSWSRTLTLMSSLRERFDLVLIDSPPLAGLADALILASQSDAVLLVVRAGLTKPADVASAVGSLQHNKTPIAGLVVFEEITADAYPYAGREPKAGSRQPAV